MKVDEGEGAPQYKLQNKIKTEISEKVLQADRNSTEEGNLLFLEPLNSHFPSKRTLKESTISHFTTSRAGKKSKSTTVFLRVSPLRSPKTASGGSRSLKKRMRNSTVDTVAWMVAGVGNPSFKDG